MKRYMEGEDRQQIVLLPPCLDDYVTENNPVRLIEAFVDELDLATLGFEGVVPEATGRPSYHPSTHARSMATSGKGTGIVGYNVQAAVDTKNHLIVAHEVTNVGHDRGQLSKMGEQAQDATGHNALTVIADRGYFKGEDILASEQGGMTAYVPKPLTSGAKAEGRFGKQDFVYVAEDNTYRCPAGESLTWRFSSVENGMVLHSYWTTQCESCALKMQCTTGQQRRIKRWEHEAVLDAMQHRLDQAPNIMRIRRQTVEHPFGTLKAWMGATHFLTRTIKRVSTEMSLHVLAYNLKRVIAILGVEPLIAAIRA
jgi:hypothetical protein